MLRIHWPVLGLKIKTQPCLNTTRLARCSDAFFFWFGLVWFFFLTCIFKLKGKDRHRWCQFQSSFDLARQGRSRFLSPFPFFFFPPVRSIILEYYSQKKKRKIIYIWLLQQAGSRRALLSSVFRMLASLHFN